MKFMRYVIIKPIIAENFYKINQIFNRSKLLFKIDFWRFLD